MNQNKERILEHSRELFLREGFNKTTMDVIASRLKISKKTIYKYFSSKDELVRESLMNFVTGNQQKIKLLIEVDTNAVEKCFNMFSYVGSMLINISENFFNDIRNFQPELWTKIDQVRTKILYQNLKLIVEQGQKEGYIIDTQSETLVVSFIISIRGILNPDSLIENKLSPSKAMHTIIEILMNGILTDKGRKIFMKLKSGENK